MFKTQTDAEKTRKAFRLQEPYILHLDSLNWKLPDSDKLIRNYLEKEWTLKKASRIDVNPTIGFHRWRLKINEKCDNVINLHERSNSNFLFKLMRILSDTFTHTHTKQECYDEGGQIP